MCAAAGLKGFVGEFPSFPFVRNKSVQFRVRLIIYPVGLLYGGRKSHTHTRIKTREELTKNEFSPLVALFLITTKGIMQIR